MQTIFDIPALRSSVDGWRRAGDKIAFVPTMGNLHDGHLTLIEKAQDKAERTIVSIFVNPIQFGKGEDYDNYPSTLESDSAKLEADGVDLLFAPDLSALYPAGIAQDTRITVPGLSNILCGKSRPEHFSGVATVVAKLLINVQPHFALFGEKDYQQLLIIQRLVRDLVMPVEIIGCPIIRESDGLAMSSRNSYLNAKQRAIAPNIYAVLCTARERIQSDPTRIAEIEKQARESLSEVGMKPEYFCVRRATDLALPVSGDCRLRILAAAWLGAARLIDNLEVVLDEPLI